MGDTLTCDECGNEIESADDLEQTEITEVEPQENGKLNLYGRTNLFLCKECRKPLGVTPRSK